MQNAESYVALGRDNTGAAAIPQSRNPIDGVFKYFDAQGAAKKARTTRLLDSLGNDLAGATSKAWEVDRPEINAELNKFLQMKADYYARGVDVTQDPKAFMEINQQKQKVIDLASKSIYDKQTYDNISKDMSRNPHMYEEKDFETIKNYGSTTASKRDKDPGVRRIPPSTYLKNVKASLGNVYETVVEKNPDGKGGHYETVRTVFNPKAAEERWNNYVATQGNGNRYDYDRLMTDAKDAAVAASAAHGMDWEQMTPQQQADLTMTTAKEMAFDMAKSDEKITTKDLRTDSSYQGGGDGVDVGNFRVNYSVLQSDTAKTPQEAPKYEVWTIRNKKANTEPSQDWRTTKDPNNKSTVKGRLNAIRRNPITGEMVFDIIRDGKYGSTTIVQVPGESNNIQGVRTKYGFDPIQLRNAHYKNWQQMIDELQPSPNDRVESPNTYTEGVVQGVLNPVTQERVNVTGKTAPAAPKTQSGTPKRNVQSLPGVVNVRK